MRAGKAPVRRSEGPGVTTATTSASPCTLNRASSYRSFAGATRGRSRSSTPIVNRPEVAILSIGRIADCPVVRDGQIVVRPVGTIALTFDHRAVGGAQAAEFGLAVFRRLEQSR